MRRLLSLVTALLCLAGLALAAPAGASTAPPSSFTPGAPGVGDPYYPLDGNGGYDVRHYDLALSYNPKTDRLWGTATITATAAQDLSRFNLDLVGLTVHSITVDGVTAGWWRHNAELVVNPRRGLRDGHRFTVVIRYGGVPETIAELFGGSSGFIHTDDGFVIMGEPHAASYWFPVNDHPTQRASYTFHLRVPQGLTAVANGVLVNHPTKRGWTTWTWDAEEPMASYLTTANVGEFTLRSYRRDGVRYWDAIDTDLFKQLDPPGTGAFLVSGQADSSFKRLVRTISVPADGASVEFSVSRSTEPGWDWFFVEAHHPGADDWTTLPDADGHTGQGSPAGCPSWLGLHPQLAHYMSDDGQGSCTPSGTTGTWWAANGTSDAAETWHIDLSDYAGTDVELSLSYASDESVQAGGVFVDDVVVSTGAGTTSFEDDGNPLDGWVVAGPPAGSPGNDTDWATGGVADLPPSVADNALGSLDQQPAMLAFMSSLFGPYPWSAGGGIVDDNLETGFALETQSRPNYALGFFSGPGTGDLGVLHENAHQWFGDNLTVKRWKEIWLNEGFATYAEWLWMDHIGWGTTQETFDAWFTGIPADDDLWKVVIGDPGTDLLFDFAVYVRGAMTLQALRMKVGDPAFFRILKRWVREHAGQSVTTRQFQALAEEVSGQDLERFFQVWLFTPRKPRLEGYDLARTVFDAPNPLTLKQREFARR